MLEYIGTQFSHPHGLGGYLATMLMNLLNHRMYTQVLKHLTQTKASDILEVGFGNGHLLKKASHVHKGTYYGVELSEDMLKRAVQDKAMQGMQLRQGRIECLPFPNDCFDYQYTVNTIYFWESLETGLKELWRCGKAGSVCVLVFYAPKWMKAKKKLVNGFHLYELQEVIATMQRCRFTIQEVRTIGKESGYCLIGQHE